MEVSVVTMGKLLYEVKGGGHGQAISKSEVHAAADEVLQPLMDLLDRTSAEFSVFHNKQARYMICSNHFQTL